MAGGCELGGEDCGTAVGEVWAAEGVVGGVDAGLAGFFGALSVLVCDGTGFAAPGAAAFVLGDFCPDEVTPVAFAGCPASGAF